MPKQPQSILLPGFEEVPRASPYDEQVWKCLRCGVVGRRTRDARNHTPRGSVICDTRLEARNLTRDFTLSLLQRPDPPHHGFAQWDRFVGCTRTHAEWLMGGFAWLLYAKEPWVKEAMPDQPTDALGVWFFSALPLDAVSAMSPKLTTLCLRRDELFCALYLAEHVPELRQALGVARRIGDLNQDHQLNWVPEILEMLVKRVGGDMAGLQEVMRRARQGTL